MEWLVTALFSMLGFDYKNKRRKDRELLERFLNVLPSDSDSILFLKDHDMGFSARYAYFSPLNRVREDWMAPDKVRLQVVRESIQRRGGRIVLAERFELVSFKQG